MRSLYIWTCAALLWTLSSVTAPAAVLRSGMSGDEVTVLQQALAQTGYLAREADGDYGSATARAVSLFQKDHDLSVTGIADERTKQRLYRMDGKKKREGGGVLFAEGNRGAEVAEIQQKLAQEGFLKEIPDGVYGPATARAVSRFQDDRDLPRSGMVDEKTMAALDEIEAEEQPDAARSMARRGTLSEGDRGPEVARLQNLLTLHGFTPGSSDGVFGQDTARALHRFQEYYDLDVSDSAGAEVWRRLEEAPVFLGNYKKVMRMHSTAYTPFDGGGSGRTASGNIAGKGHAAVDPSVIPLGSLIFIENYGYALADDIGGSINGHTVDVGVDTLDQAYRWGSRRVTVYLVD